MHAFPEHRVIHLHREAPAHPAPGAPCNGCGVCCATEPCPLGMLLSGRRRGRCTQLRWEGGAARYRCGLMEAPPGDASLAARIARRTVARVAARWIAAGIGCDSSLVVEARGS